MDDSYYHEVDAILEHFDVKPDVGLDEERVAEQRKTHGWNGESIIYYITIIILLALWFCNFKKCELDASCTCIMDLFLSLFLFYRITSR